MAEARSELNHKPGTPGFLVWFPWEKLTIWGLFLLAVYALRHFFFTIFMTFMITYIMRNVVRSVMRILSPQTERAWLQRVVSAVAFVLLIGVLCGVGTFLYRPLRTQAEGLYYRIRSSVNFDDFFNDVLRQTVGAWRYKSKYSGKEGEEQKTKDLEEFLKKKPNDYEGFRKQAVEIKESFKNQVILEDGERMLRDLKAQGKEDLQLRIWVLENIASKKFNEKKDELIGAWKEKNRELDDWYWKKFKKLPPKDYFESKKFEEDRDDEIKGDLVDSDLRENRAKLTDDFTRYLGTLKYEDLSRDNHLEERFRVFYENLPKSQKPLYKFERFQALDSLRSREAFEAEMAAGDTQEERDKRVEEQFRLSKEKALVDEVINQEDLVSVKRWLTQQVPDLANLVKNVSLDFINLLVQFFLSLLLSFFITFDLFKLRRGIHKLEQSHLRDFYREIAPGLINFGRLIGRSFQAQGAIAVCNTALTFLAIKYLGIQNEIFLASIVFLCSFIPVLGVVISVVPISAMAIIQPSGGIVDNGILLALLAIAAILVVHFIETSILNPKILGDMLHLHPVMVLGILAVGEYFFGVWGLLLGVPVAVYIFRYVILGEELDFAPAGARAKPLPGGPPHAGPPPAPPPQKPAAPPTQPVGAGPAKL